MEVGCQRGVQADTQDDWFGVVMEVHSRTRMLMVCSPLPLLCCLQAGVSQEQLALRDHAL